MDYCGACAHLEKDNKEKYTSKDRYWCRERHEYRELTERACYNFLKDPSTQKNDGGYQPAGCYITTMVCQILGYADDCELLNTLRNFRESFLRPNIHYLPMLLEYDIVGPIISKKIINMPDNYEFCLNITKNYLIPCVNLIQEEAYEEAILNYQNMVHYLMNYFNIISPVININNINYESQNVGKGRVRIKYEPLKES